MQTRKLLPEASPSERHTETPRIYTCGWNVLYQRDAHLRPVAQETAAVRSAAATHRFLVAETVQVIVKGQLSSFHTTEAER